MSMNLMEILSKMTYTSDRVWEGTVYTISDIRYPDYNGKKIIVKIVKGKSEASWYTS
jgi:hypothetical protein